jgi:hypothetical protein
MKQQPNYILVERNILTSLDVKAVLKHLVKIAGVSENGRSSAETSISSHHGHDLHHSLLSAGSGNHLFLPGWHVFLLLLLNHTACKLPN